MSDDEQADWASRVTGSIEQLAHSLQDHSVRPLGRALRLLSLSVVLGLLGVAALVVAVIGLGRLLDDDVFSGRAWATDLLFGGMFGLLGMFMLLRGAKARSRHG